MFNKQKEGDPAKKFPAARPFAIEQGSLNSSVQGKKEKVNAIFSMWEPVEETEALIAMHNLTAGKNALAPGPAGQKK